jgi:LysM repeat protein
LSLFATPAYAGIADFIGSFLINNAQGEIIAPSKNSQTIPLLSASLNTNPSVSHRADISISEDGAISADNGPAGNRVDVAPIAPQDQISVYVVHEGDTLAEIAKTFGVSKETIVWANDLKGNAVKPGQMLTILPISGVIHTVKKGETLSSIASKYKIDADEIIGFNDLSENPVLLIGDEIVVPNGKIQITPTPKSSAPKASNAPVYAGYYKAPLASYRRSQGLHGNNSVDLAAPAGSPIYASAAGSVVISKQGSWNGGYGNYVVISHGNGTQTLYAHNSRNAVSVGDQVEQGQVIGYVGTTGRVTGPHVHFEVRGAKNPF